MTTTAKSVRSTIAEPTFDVARNMLLNYKGRTDNVLPVEFWKQLARIKEEYVDQGDQLGAKAAWCLETVGRIQDNFISAFMSMRAGEYRTAWDLLDQCEGAINSVARHFIEEQDEFGIRYIGVHTRQLQELFNLKWGFSPGLLFEEVLCSICQQKLTLRGDCGHEIGEIYNGEICGRVVTEVSLLHISLVDNPAQKSSVIWPDDDGAAQFELLRNLVNELLSPWDSWRYYKEIRRRHHPAFKGVGRNDSCPCGSEVKYKRCCMNKDTVPDFPHYRFTFDAETRGQIGSLRIFSKPLKPLSTR